MENAWRKLGMPPNFFDYAMSILLRYLIQLAHVPLGVIELEGIVPRLGFGENNAAQEPFTVMKGPIKGGDLHCVSVLRGSGFLRYVHSRLDNSFANKKACIFAMQAFLLREPV